MYKISKLAVLSLLLLAGACGPFPMKKSSHSKSSQTAQTSVAHEAALEASMDSFCYCPAKAGTVGVTHFDFDSSVVLPSARELISGKIAECVAARLKEDPTIKVLVTGHADKRGTQEYNLALGTRRASATKDFLYDVVKAHAEEHEISQDRFCINSKGKEELVDHGDTEEAHAKNRRTVIEFVEECH